MSSKSNFVLSSIAFFGFIGIGYLYLQNLHKYNEINKLCLKNRELNAIIEDLKETILTLRESNYHFEETSKRLENICSSLRIKNKKLQDDIKIFREFNSEDPIA